MTLPRVVLCSMWRNDCARRLVDRVDHLLAKSESYPNMRWVWVVGDSTDHTTDALWTLTTKYPVTIVDIGSTGIEGEDVPTRLRRLSETGNEWWNWIDDAEYVMIHESDILSPANVVNRMVAHAERGKCPIAGWPTLTLQGRKLFYDVWAYRKDGVLFTNNAPYHSCYRPDTVFEVDSFGSVYLFHAEDVPLVRFHDRAVLDLCRQLREQGRTLYVDPTLEVIQPADLWQFHEVVA